jgi:hypothetical protein
MRGLSLNALIADTLSRYGSTTSKKTTIKNNLTSAEFSTVQAE